MKPSRRKPQPASDLLSDQDIQRIRTSRGVLIPPLEQARIYAKLLKKPGIASQRHLAEYLGVTQTTISQKLALLDLPQEIADLLARPDSNLTERHIRSLRRLHNEELQHWLAKRIVEDRLTIEQTEDIVLNMLDELGIRTRTKRGWSQAPGLRWRFENDELVLRVHGASHSHRLKALKRFVSIFRKEPRA